MASEWRFITTQADKRRSDPASRRAIRENAMRAFRRNQRFQMVKAYQEEYSCKPATDSGFASQRVALPATHVGVSTGTDIKLEESPALGHTGHQPIEIGISSSIDPFSSTVLYEKYNSPQLFSHCTFRPDELP